MVGEAIESQKPRIVSLGGGTISQPQNVALLRRDEAVLIWLQCPVDELLLRCAHDYRPAAFPRRSQFSPALSRSACPPTKQADYRVDSTPSTLRAVEQILALGIFPR